MTKKTKMGLWIVGLPFVVSTSNEFLPFWLAWPITLICIMQWIGACIVLTECKEQQ